MIEMGLPKMTEVGVRERERERESNLEALRTSPS